MAYTLPSESTFREDLIWLKKGDEETAQKFKIKLEEIQRKKRAREAYEKKIKVYSISKSFSFKLLFLSKFLD
jgi:hypothetical protein